MDVQAADFTIERLGSCRFPSPMREGRFIAERERLLYHSRFEEIQPYITAGEEPPSLELAGPRGLNSICRSPSLVAEVEGMAILNRDTNLSRGINLNRDIVLHKGR